MGVVLDNEVQVGGVTMLPSGCNLYPNLVAFLKMGVAFNNEVQVGGVTVLCFGCNLYPNLVALL